MVTNTTNYNLKKPGVDDFYNVADANNNMDIIDANLKSVSDVANTANVKGDTALSHIADSGIHVTSADKTNFADKYTKTEVDNKFSAFETGIDWKEAVATYANIVTTYPNPVDGWTVNVKDTDYTYRYNGSAWVAISANAIPKATASVDGLMAKEDKAKLDATNVEQSISSRLSSLFKNGIVPDQNYSAGDFLRVESNAPELMSVVILPGSMIIDGYQYTLAANAYLSIDIIQAQEGRIDRIIVELNRSTHTFTLKVLKGQTNESGLEIAPTLTRNSSVYQMSLAQVHAQTSGTIANITSERIDETVCGVARATQSIPVDGWVSANEAWTYAGADSPVFTITVPGDVTGKYSRGMRFKLTQGVTVKYFILVEKSYSSPNTTLTLFGGDSYTLTNETITNNYYSSAKAPYGFSVDPDRWTVSATLSSDVVQNNPVPNTYYNALSIVAPIGLWRTKYDCSTFLYRSTTGGLQHMITLSTANNTESDKRFTCDSLTNPVTYFGASVSKNNKILNVATKTTYYLNFATPEGGVTSITIKGTFCPIEIGLECAYL